jgi:hypothetical protein
MPVMWKFLLAIAAALAAVAEQVMGQSVPLAVTMWGIAGLLGVWAFVTLPPVIRIGRRFVPSFIRPAPTPPELRILDVLAAALRLWELFSTFVQPMRRIERDIAAISAAYRPRREAEWNAGTGRAAVQRTLRVARREARAINRHLDRLDPLALKFEEETATITETVRGMEQRVRDAASDRAGLIVVRSGMVELVVTMKSSREVDETFRSFMASLHGFADESKAWSARGAAIGARIVAAHDKILEACEHILSTTNDLLNRPS